MRISGIFQRISNYIRANSITIVRITGFIIVAFVFWMCAHIGQCAVQNIQLVIYTVIIPICAAMKLRYPALIVVLRPGRRGVLVMCRYIKHDTAKYQKCYYYCIIPC